ncbi:MAG TPA: hypothetical protein VGQ10_15585, partial [Vicinamibacterales bacterium]|nr:hypothetical protein [Vicinamibacterales bacterium]
MIQLILLSRVHAENAETRGPHRARLRGGVQMPRMPFDWPPKAPHRGRERDDKRRLMTAPFVVALSSP